MKLPKSVKEWIDVGYYSPATEKLYRNVMKKFIEFTGKRKGFTAQDLLEFSRWVRKQDWSKKTKRTYLTVVKAFYNFHDIDRQEIKRKVKMPRTRKKSYFVLDEEQLQN